MTMLCSYSDVIPFQGMTTDFSAMEETKRVLLLDDGFVFILRLCLVTRAKAYKLGVHEDFSSTTYSFLILKNLTCDIISFAYTNDHMMSMAFESLSITPM